MIRRTRSMDRIEVFLRGPSWFSSSFLEGRSLTGSIAVCTSLRFSLHLVVMCPAVVMTSSLVCAEEFLLLPGSSFYRGELEADVPLEGVLVGDFDPQTNPLGTETRPPSSKRGNVPIPMFGSLLLAGSFDGLQPSGWIDADWDLATASMVIHAFDIDLGGSGPGPVPLDQWIDTISSPFVTVRPDGVFPMGISEPIILRDADVLSMRFHSEGPVPADLLFVTDEIWAVFASIEGRLEIKVDTEGGIVTRTAFISLPTNGVIFLDQGPRLELGFFSSSAEGMGSESFPVSDLSFGIDVEGEDGEAGLLFSGMRRDPGFDLFIDLGIASVAGPLPDPDLDGDGRVDAVDLGLVLLEWGHTGRNAADLDRNGVIGSGDLARLLIAWSSEGDD